MPPYSTEGWILLTTKIKRRLTTAFLYGSLYFDIKLTFDCNTMRRLSKDTNSFSNWQLCNFPLAAWIFVLFAWSPNSNAANEVITDVCVYGGTSGGVIAAVRAARMGKSVALVVVNNHLGGMTSGGLGNTDVGNNGSSYIQGDAWEFYARIGQKYGSASARFTFEPRIAETVFNEMVSEAGLAVYTNQYLVSVTKQGPQILAATMNNGNIFRAKMFIDASYEGDLMAQAGVSYTVGREATSQYGESINGIRTPNTGGHQFGSYNINPYVVTNNPASGLIPLIQTNSPGTPGAADQRIQAYNFRMCLTQNVTNQLPIPAPTNYDAFQYELVARYLQANAKATNLASFMNIGVMPNGKTDINNNGPVSTDFIGQNYHYPEADYSTRQQIWQAHKNHIQGFFHFLATDLRVPGTVRTQMQSYGFCKDEYVDTGGWPYQLYVREARRMVADYVMTRSNCTGQVTVPDGVALASYTMDSHNCQRCVVSGYVQNEGDVQSGVPAPYPIAYRALVPKSGECSNLLVPWCLSASHIAFGSIRMETVFMMLGQAAGTAASIAIDDAISVQNVGITKLQTQLRAYNQTVSTSVYDPDPGAVIVDNADTNRVSIVGDWNFTGSAGSYGNGAIYANGTGNTNTTKSVTFNPNLPTGGSYQIYARWSASSNRATNAPIDVIYSGNTNTFYLNQTINGGQWIWLLTTNFIAGTNVSVRVRNSDNATARVVIADAIKFSTNLPTIDIWANHGQASPYGLQSGGFTLYRSGAITNLPTTVYFNFSGSATNGVDYQPISSITLPPRINVTNISLVRLPQSSPVGNKIASLTIAPNSNYLIGSLNTADISVDDTPINQWRFQYFGTNAANSSMAGNSASPAGDGISNLMKYALGLNPTNFASEPLFSYGIDTNGCFVFSYTRPDPPPPDINYSIDVSTDLSAWCTNNLCVGNLSIAIHTNATASVTHQGEVPIQAADRKFLRLSVSQK